MKKIVTLGLSTMLALGSLVPVASASANSNENYSIKVQESASSSLTLTEDLPSSVLVVAPYVHKNDQGFLYIDKNIPEDIYTTYNVVELEKSFEEINAQVASGVLTINDDLSITSNEIVTMSSKGYTSKRYWWGEKATYTNTQAKTAARQAQSAAVDTALITAGTLFIPVFGQGFAAISGLTSAYLFKLSDSMTVKNKGKGVIVNMTWALVFTVESR